MRTLIICCFVLFSTSSTFASKTIYKKYQISSGDTIYSLLKRFYFSKDQINSVMALKSSFEEAYELFPKQIFWVGVLEKEGKTKLKFFHPLKDETLTIWRKAQQAGATKEPQKFTIKTKTAQGKIVGSLLSSISGKVTDKNVVYRFMNAFEMDANLKRDVQKNAKFSLTYEEKYLGGHFVKTGEVLKAELELKGALQKRYFIKTKNGGGTFINPKDLKLRRPLYLPVNYLRVTSLYQPRRFHPIKKRYIAHRGVDFELAKGDPVLASLEGTVVKKGRTRGAGKYVVIRHNGNLKTYYNHLSKIRSDLEVGQQVNSGEKIGAIGCTGYCTKPHLHFAVKYKNRYVNPTKYLKSYSFKQSDIVFKQASALRSKYSL